MYERLRGEVNSLYSIEFCFFRLMYYCGTFVIVFSDSVLLVINEFQFLQEIFLVLAAHVLAKVVYLIHNTKLYVVFGNTL